MVSAVRRQIHGGGAAHPAQDSTRDPLSEFTAQPTGDEAASDWQSIGWYSVILFFNGGSCDPLGFKKISNNISPGWLVFEY